jgi:hypothetical protein
MVAHFGGEVLVCPGYGDRKILPGSSSTSLQLFPDVLLVRGASWSKTVVEKANDMPVTVRVGWMAFN